MSGSERIREVHGSKRLDKLDLHRKRCLHRRSCIHSFWLSSDLLIVPPGLLTAGWAIPILTDTAGAVALIDLPGDRAPSEFRVFLTAVVIIDDLVTAHLPVSASRFLFIAGVAFPDLMDYAAAKVVIFLASLPAGGFWIVIYGRKSQESMLVRTPSSMART